MYNDRPKAAMPALLLILAAFFAFLAWKTPDDGRLLSGVKLIFILVALFFGVYGVLELIGYLVDLTAYSRRELNESSFTIMLAHSLAGASPGVIDAINRHGGEIQVLGIMAEKLEVKWRISALPVDIDWEFAQGFIRASESLYPNLLPVGRCDDILDDHGLFFVNYERQGKAFTDLLITEGVARPGRGSQSAVLLIPWQDLAEKFGVEA
jgi:hypothetical protein